ncbi:MAG TPA: Yip1 family protein [Gammaproteobacteria bacterium]|nr:Yip1 family protein [Gammaproteobacteria bacterium]
MNIDRIKNILLQPVGEWQKIAAEPADMKSLYVNYAMILAAIPAIAGFIGSAIVGHAIPFAGTTIRLPIVTALGYAISEYILSLIGVYLVSLLVDALAPTFGGEKNQINALKLTIYSSTAGWLAGIFAILPGLQMLGILGLYGAYLFYTGLPVLMKCPSDKAAAYTVVSILAAALLFSVAGMVGGGMGHSALH